MHPAVQSELLILYSHLVTFFEDGMLQLLIRSFKGTFSKG
jgi:hypothetical protein